MIFLECGPAQEQVIRRIFTALSQLYKDYVISVSMGIATAKDVGSNYGAMFRAADQALYFAKENGHVVTVSTMIPCRTCSCCPMPKSCVSNPSRPRCDTLPLHCRPTGGAPLNHRKKRPHNRLPCLRCGLCSLLYYARRRFWIASRSNAIAISPPPVMVNSVVPIPPVSGSSAPLSSGGLVSSRVFLTVTPLYSSLSKS